MNPQLPCFIWKNPEIQGNPPQARHGHSAIQYQNWMIIFGGEDNETGETLCDIHQLDLETWAWIQPQVSGEIPSRRSFHTAVLAQDQMLVWGGYEKAQDGGYLFSDTDLHLLDLKTWHWSRVKPSGSSAEARSHHSATLFKDQLLIDGGSYDIYSTRDDLQILNLTKMCWVPIQVANSSSSALAGLKVRGNTLIKFLGDAAYGGFCSDIWTLDLTNFDAKNPLELEWQKAQFQGMENYNYEILLPECEPDEEVEIVDWEDGIPYRTIHGYGELGDNLLLFAGMAPGNGVSHVTIGDLVLLNMPSIPETASEIYTAMIPQIQGEFPTPRFGHSTIQFNHQMIIFGGLWIDTYRGNNYYENQVHILEDVRFC